MGFTQLLERAVMGDLVQWVVHPAYCFESSKITNPAAGTCVSGKDVVGCPVKLVSGVWTFVLAADIANATGVVVKGPKLPALLAASTATSDVYLILARAPAILVKDKLSSTDARDSAITMATYYSTLEALKYVLRSEPTSSVKSTQTS